MSTNFSFWSTSQKIASQDSIRFPVRFKITLPYLLLSVILALSGSYIVLQMIFDTLENRFENQLIESGKLASDRMVLEEKNRLETLRLITNTAGLAEAVQNQNSETVRELILPIAVNNNEHRLVVLDSNGLSLLALTKNEGAAPAPYLFTKGETHYSDLTVVQSVLRQELDNGRDKFAGFVSSSDENYFYVAGPVYANDDEFVGVVLVGVPLAQLISDFRKDTLAHITIYSSDGGIVATTLLLFDDTNLELAPADAQYLGTNQDQVSLRRETTVGSVDYGEIIGPWEARDGQDIGLIGASLPKNFLINTSSTTRLQFGAFILFGIILVVTVGVYISRIITQPLIKVVDASAQVASGDLNVKVEPTGQDEITILAKAFNRMVDGLQEATERRVREIELLNKLEQERELNELKSRFVSMVSHEFRTPLTTILSSSQFIRKYGHSVSPDKQEKHFDRIEETVEHMTNMLEEVLFIGRADADRADFNPEYFDFVIFCQDIIDQVQMAVESHNIVFSQLGECKWINADKSLLKNIFYNLLSNAVKYSPEEAQVKFNLLCELDQFVIQIIDRGIGIPPDDLKNLFQPFHRAKNASNISGTGLGLYVTKIAVELHHGEILVDSEVGVGTTFTVKIPVKQQ